MANFGTATTRANTPPSRLKLIAILAAGALVIGGGITATAIGVTSYKAETTSLCTAAVTAGTRAATSMKTALAASDAAVLAVAVLELPVVAEGVAPAISTDYAARVAVEAVPAVDEVLAIEATAASEGVEAVDAVAGITAVEAFPARASGTELISDVSAASTGLANITIAAVPPCATRDQVASITATNSTAATATTALTASVAVLTSDFAVFQTEEAARIAAEIEAARVAAEAEAARVAAAAAQEAARVAANQATAKKSASSGSSGGGSTSGGSGSKNGDCCAGAFGPDKSDGTGCRIDNGVGGFYSC
ncbi:hypothetical protein [Cryobacterium suzukii]|uniref:hypothetical protein n=1 Tax=Cryobacterium suzukii TaxID=1259198 RepID=UPI001882AA5D|nr:hypothetical protein [Cryobacterium suzukii]